MSKQMNSKQQNKIAGYLGLAQRAGRIAAGDSSAREALLKGRAALLIIAEDAAASVQEELRALAETAQVPLLMWPDKVNLGLIVGKSRRGALALLDQGFATAILKVLQSEKS